MDIHFSQVQLKYYNFHQLTFTRNLLFVSFSWPNFTFPCKRGERWVTGFCPYKANLSQTKAMLALGWAVQIKKKPDIFRCNFEPF